MRDIYVYVKLEGPKYEWRTVRAADISSGIELAEQMPDVIAVLEGSIIPGGVLT